MRPGPAQAREKPEEVGRILAAVEDAINPFSEKRLDNDTAKKTGEASSFKVKPSETSKILQGFMFRVRKGGYPPRSPTE
jgi:hypothetical protein